MVEPSSSPDDFAIQLAQWALDQLKTFDSLVMVYDRFAALLSQTPQPSDDNDLHARLGQLIFTKATRHSTDPLVDLCVRLCCLLSSDSIGNNKDRPDGIAYIHDHVFRCCKEFLKPSGTIQTARTGPKATLPTRDGENSAMNNQEDPSLNHTSLLVSKLYDTGLTSTANIHEYLQHLAASSLQIDARIEAICTLFEAHGTELSVEPWKGDRDSLFQWARTAVLQYPVTESTKNRLEAIVAKHPYSKNQSATQPLPRWQAMVKCQIETLLEMFLGQESDFSLISSQIIERVNNSKEEQGASTLKQVVELVFERAIENKERSEVYARLCRTISEHTLPRVQDETVRDPDGQPISGGNLFRRYLVNMFQECFKGVWSVEEIDPTLNNSSASPTNSYETSNLKNRMVMTRGQGIGLTQLIIELFKLDPDMLTKSIIHECIKRLLSNLANPKEEDVESLCKLLTAAGKTLDDSWFDQMDMNIYFERMQTISSGSNVNPRMRNMLVDVIRLRRQWQATKPQPQTTSSIRGQRGRGRGAQRGVQRGGFRGGFRGGEWRDTTDPDGWDVLGGSNARPPARAGDLSQFGKVSKPTGVQFGPSSVFSKRDPNREAGPSIASRNSFSLMEDDDFSPFSRLANDRIPFSRSDYGDGFGERPTNSHRAGWGFGSGGPAAPKAEPVRRKLDLLPRSKPIVADRREARGAVAMSEEQAWAKVREDVRAYMRVENIDDAIMALEALPAHHRHLFVQRVVYAALYDDDKTVALAERLFAAAHQRGVISPRNFEHGLLPMVKSAERLSIEVPRTYEWLARLIIAAGLDRSKAKGLASQIRVEGERLMPPKDLLMRAYEKALIKPA